MRIRIIQWPFNDTRSLSSSSYLEFELELSPPRDLGLIGLSKPATNLKDLLLYFLSIFHGVSVSETGQVLHLLLSMSLTLYYLYNYSDDFVLKNSLRTTLKYYLTFKMLSNQ